MHNTAIKRMTSGRHLGKGAAAVATGGVIAATALIGTAAATPQAQTLHLTAKTTTEAMIRPCPSCVRTTPSGQHIGGSDIQSGNVYDQHGVKVGHFALLAVSVTSFTQKAPGELLLDATLRLANGQIATHGLELPPDNNGTLAITGGTGSYQTARGEIHFNDVNQTTTDLQVVIRG